MFAVAVADAETGSNMTPVSTGTNTSSTIQSVQTGDTARLWFCIAELLLTGTGTELPAQLSGAICSESGGSVKKNSGKQLFPI